MRSKNLFTGLLAAALAGASATAFAVENTSAFIDMERTFKEFYKTKTAQEKLDSLSEEYREEMEKMKDELVELDKEFQADREDSQNTALSEEARDAKRNAAEEKLIQVQEYKGKMQRYERLKSKQLEDQSRRIQNTIVEEIETAVKDYARSEGYKSVMDSSGRGRNGVKLIMYTDDAIDITDEVLEILNTGNPTPEG